MVKIGSNYLKNKLSSVDAAAAYDDVTAAYADATAAYANAALPASNSKIKSCYSGFWAELGNNLQNKQQELPILLDIHINLNSLNYVA